MKIQYYGTGAGAGIPEIFCSCRVCEQARRERGKNIRSRSQAVVDDCLSIDFSVDAFMHTVHGGLDMRRVRHVLITHNHHDHFMGADVVSRPLWSGEPMRFYGSEKSVGGLYRHIQNTEQAYNEGRRIRTSDYCPEVHFLEMFKPAEIGGYTVTPLHARHAEAIDSMLFIISKDGKNILWGHDTGLLHTDTKEYLKACGLRFNFVSLDCTLARGKQITKNHMDIEWCAQTAAFLREIGCVDDKTVIALSHIGHLVERTHDELEKEAAAFGFEVAWDGRVFEF